MFGVNKPVYLTPGLKAEVAPEVIMKMVQSIMDMKQKEEVEEIDHLQIFNFEESDDEVIVTHTQEVPPFNKSFTLPTGKAWDKVYAIDDQTHVTFMFAHEY